jgi:hypothetical protein
MNTYFKICSAEHEIVRLNVEIRRLQTFMVDEEHFLQVRAQALFDEKPEIAFQIERLRQRRVLVNAHHHKQLDPLFRRQVEGFSGFITIGQHKGPAQGIKDESSPRVTDSTGEDQPLDTQDKDDDDEGEQDDSDIHDFMSVMAITDDFNAVDIDS